MAKADLRTLLAQAQGSRNRVRCATCRLIAELAPDDSQALQDALEDPEVSNPVMASALGAFGFSVSASAIGRHRRECR